MVSHHIFILGKYPCLWCLITSTGMQLPQNDSQRGNTEERTLVTLQKDYNKFVEYGSCTSWQKFFHNVIHENLVDTDLDKVSLFESNAINFVC